MEEDGDDGFVVLGSKTVPEKKSSMGVYTSMERRVDLWEGVRPVHVRGRYSDA